SSEARRQKGVAVVLATRLARHRGAVKRAVDEDGKELGTAICVPLYFEGRQLYMVGAGVETTIDYMAVSPGLGDRVEEVALMLGVSSMGEDHRQLWMRMRAFAACAGPAEEPPRQQPRVAGNAATAEQWWNFAMRADELLTAAAEDQTIEEVI
ncbi:hypothetical protein IWQ56_006623, partial [Coemansia nantahalensis]